GEAPSRVARDPHDGAVDLRRIAPVDLDLGGAGGLALIKRRKIEEGEFYRALDLEHALAGEEHNGRVRIDALDLGAAVRRRIGEQGEDRLLRVGGVIPWLRKFDLGLAAFLQTSNGCRQVAGRSLR